MQVTRTIGAAALFAAGVAAAGGITRQAVLAVIERYRTAFDQQSVLWETSRVCVAS